MKKTQIISICAILVSAIGLTSCEKPNPGVTVWSGTNSEHREAVCWTEQDAITPEECAQDIVLSALNDPEVATIPVLADQTVGISVDPDVAEHGWFVAVGGQRFNDGAIYSTYYRLTFPKVYIPEGGYDMQVIAQGKGNATRGIWVFKLINDSTE